MLVKEERGVFDACWSSRNPVRQAVTPKTMRLRRAVIRISPSEVNEDDPNRNMSADNPYTTVKQMPKKEEAKDSLAHTYDDKNRREV